MIIFDFSTLILLAKIDILELFISNIKRKILVPPTVKLEVCVQGRKETPLVIRLIEEKKISILKVKKLALVEKIMKDFGIDRGEAEAIILAIQEKTNIVATDDGNAIKACKVLKVDFFTAITILIMIREKGLIEKNDALNKLKSLEIFGRYSKRILEDATKRMKGR